MTAVNKLVTTFRKNPKEVGAWLADDSQELTRGSVKLLREFLADKRRQADEDESIPDTAADPSDSPSAAAEAGKRGRTRAAARSRAGAETLRKAVIRVEHKGRAARLILDRRPPAEGWAWLRYEDDGMEREAELAQVKLVALMEGGRGEG